MKCRGFSLAEILITLVILGFVGALGVPMIGQQKLKKPIEVIARHGTMECFYDHSGVLHQYRANNTENKNGVDEAPAEPDACYFSAPSANLFVIQAVGAGGGGAIGAGMPKYTPQTVPVNGYIRTNEGFLADINNKDKVPDWVREEWDKQWTDNNWIQYTIQSPIGSSGKAVCEPRRKENTMYLGKDCVELCTIDILANCPKECRDDLEAKGGASDSGAKYVVKTKIGVADDIIFGTTIDATSLSIGAKNITLQVSTKGEDAKINYPSFGVAQDGKNGEAVKSYVLSNGNGPFVSFSGGDMKIQSKSKYGEKQLGGTGCSQQQGKPAIKGAIIGGNPPNIRFTTQSLGVNATFGVAGSAGESKMKIMEKMPENTRLKLVPARDTTQRSIVYIEIDGEWKKFLDVDSGGDGHMTSEVIPIEKGDFPFPKRYYPSAFEADEPEFSIASGAGYKSLIARMGYKPGASGAGAYPVITHVTGSAVHWINGTKTGDEPLKPLDGGMAAVQCLTGGSPVGGYCGSPNTSGNPGAVVITW